MSKSALSCLLFALASPHSEPTAESLRDLRWEKRVIIAATPAGGEKLVEALEERREGIEDRHVAWFVFDEEGVRSNLGEVSEELAASARSRLRQEGKASEVVLIGKDGGVKDRADALDLDRLFGLIDSMPMRQQEMKGR